MKNKKTTNPMNNYISIVTAFFLSIFLTLICLLVGTNFGLLNKALISDAMNKSAYYESVNSYTLEEIADLAIPLGLDTSVFENVFTLQSTYTEGKALLDANLSGEGYTVDTTQIEQRLRENITQYAMEHQVEITPEVEEGIDYFLEQVRFVYVQNLTVPFLNYYAGLHAMLQEILIIALPILLVLSVLAMFLLVQLQPWLHRALRMAAYSFTGAAMMTAFLPAYLLISRTYERLHISPFYFHRLLTRYLRQSLFMYIDVAIVMAAIALFIIALIVQLKKRLVH